MSVLGELDELVNFFMLGCVHQDRPFFIWLLLLHQHLSSWEAFVPAENMPNPFKSLLSHEDHEVAFVATITTTTTTIVRTAVSVVLLY